MAPRPASTMNFSFPTSMSVLGPKRSILGGGAPLPKRVTRKRSRDVWAMNSPKRRGIDCLAKANSYHSLLSRTDVSTVVAYSLRPMTRWIRIVDFGQIPGAVARLPLLQPEMIEQNEPPPCQQDHPQRGTQFPSPRHILLHSHNRTQH